MSTDRWQPPAKLGDLLPAALEATGASNVWLEVRIRSAWPDAVGAQLAQRTRVLRLRRGTLEVSVIQDAWATQVRYLATEIVRRINETLGQEVVRELVTRRERGPGERSDAEPEPPVRWRRRRS